MTTMIDSCSFPAAAKWGLSLTSLLLMLAGCSSSEFDLAPVVGKVTLEGKPFSWGSVMFSPIAQAGEIESGKPAFGVLAADGTFELSTYSEKDGAVIGDHWVSIYRIDDGPNGAPPGSLPRFRRLLLKDKTYAVVAGEDNEFVFDITAEDLRKHAVN